MNRRGRRAKPTLLITVIAVVATVLVLPACTTQVAWYGSAGAAGSGDGAESGSDDTGTTPDGESPPVLPEREHFFETPEDAIVATPWFSVSSVIVRVRRRAVNTVIVLPEDSVMRDYMRLDPGIVLDRDDVPVGGNLMVGVGIVTDGVPPFVSNPDAYRYPDQFER